MGRPQGGRDGTPRACRDGRWDIVSGCPKARGRAPMADRQRCRPPSHISSAPVTRSVQTSEEHRGSRRGRLTWRTTKERFVVFYSLRGRGIIPAAPRHPPQQAGTAAALGRHGQPSRPSHGKKTTKRNKNTLGGSVLRTAPHPCRSSTIAKWHLSHPPPPTPPRADRQTEKQTNKPTQ